MKRDTILSQYKYNNLSKSERLQADVIAIRMRLGTEIRNLRTSEANLSAEKLASLAEISPKTLSKIENGKSVEIDGILRALNVMGFKFKITSKMFD